MNCDDAGGILCAWFASHRRDLPWRSDPSPYHVWVSEIMLQQTRVEAVKPYYERFIAQLPDIAALAACPEDRLHKLWEGLGYYSRVRNMQRCAVILTEQYCGALPADYDSLLSLPGIGPYTAGAIASIAFGIPVPVVDGNVLRVVTRLTADRRDIRLDAVKRDVFEKLKPLLLAEMRETAEAEIPETAEAEVQEAADAEMPETADAKTRETAEAEVQEALIRPGNETRKEKEAEITARTGTETASGSSSAGEGMKFNYPGTVNQALMEIGALVCVPNGSPLCGQCPLAGRCQSRILGLTDQIPFRSAPKKRRVEEKTVLVLLDGDHTLIRKREESGLLAGMYELPSLPGKQTPEQVLSYLREELKLEPLRIRELPRAKHIFSHIEWKMTGYRVLVVSLENVAPDTGFLVVEPEETQRSYPVPAAFRAYASALSIRLGKEGFQKEIEQT